MFVTGNTAQMTPKAIYIGERAAKTLDKKKNVCKHQQLKGNCVSLKLRLSTQFQMKKKSGLPFNFSLETYLKYPFILKLLPIGVVRT